MDLEDRICSTTGASRAVRAERIQSLWSGWGEIVRFRLEGGPVASVIVKHVQSPDHSHHPRGWSSPIAADRKRRSYTVEEAFYRDFAPSLDPATRCARVFHLEPGLFVLEDLDAAGFAGRAVGTGSLPDARVEQCIAWLARFHAAFLGRTPDGLWETGTYWHLATRPDELDTMPDSALKNAAAAIDAHLNATAFPTLVHGDAKVANFCFGPDGVAMVDFQYTGGGAGVKDLAYFLGSCLDDATLERDGAMWTDRYFDTLTDLSDSPGLREDWEARLPFAWADFERFLAGWAPGHWKRSGYAHRQTQAALEALG